MDRSTSLCPQPLTQLTSERGPGLNFSWRHRGTVLPSTASLLETMESKERATVAAGGCAVFVPAESGAGMGESRLPQMNAKLPAQV